MGKGTRDTQKVSEDIQFSISEHGPCDKGQWLMFCFSRGDFPRLCRTRYRHDHLDSRRISVQSGRCRQCEYSGDSGNRRFGHGRHIVNISQRHDRHHRPLPQQQLRLWSTAGSKYLHQVLTRMSGANYRKFTSNMSRFRNMYSLATVLNIGRSTRRTNVAKQRTKQPQSLTA